LEPKDSISHHFSSLRDLGLERLEERLLLILRVVRGHGLSFSVLVDLAGYKDKNP
jgi:hypothetical protein